MQAAPATPGSPSHIQVPQHAKGEALTEFSMGWDLNSGRHIESIGNSNTRARAEDSRSVITMAIWIQCAHEQHAYGGPARARISAQGWGYRFQSKRIRKPQHAYAKQHEIVFPILHQPAQRSKTNAHGGQNTKGSTRRSYDRTWVTKPSASLNMHADTGPGQPRPAHQGVNPHGETSAYMSVQHAVSNIRRKNEEAWQCISCPGLIHIIRLRIGGSRGN